MSTISIEMGRKGDLLMLSQETCHKEVHVILREIGGCYVCLILITGINVYILHLLL